MPSTDPLETSGLVEYSTVKKTTNALILLNEISRQQYQQHQQQDNK